MCTQSALALIPPIAISLMLIYFPTLDPSHTSAFAFTVKFNRSKRPRSRFSASLSLCICLTLRLACPRQARFWTQPPRTRVWPVVIFRRSPPLRDVTVSVISKRRSYKYCTMY